MLFVEFGRIFSEHYHLPAAGTITEPTEFIYTYTTKKIEYDVLTMRDRTNRLLAVFSII